MKRITGKTYQIRVLGCKVNQYEACQIEQRLQEYGLSACGEDGTADLVVVHGCAVTAVAARKSRQALRKLRKENPHALIVMTGCSAAVSGFDAVAESCVTVLPGTKLLTGLDYAVQEYFLKGDGSKEYVVGNADAYPLYRFAERTRAFLKIQDGCSIGCSYCIVPSLRGKPRDKQLDVILNEARGLVENGYREIVIAGVSVGLYGTGGADCSLAKILRELTQLDGVERIRMSSLHPHEVTDELLDVWGSSSRMMPHVHLPLQAGSNRVLLAMKRRYTREEFLHAINRFREVLDTPAFTTDVITGFPGETDEDFQQTVDIAEQVGFSKMHIFPYSERPGTLAVKLPGKVPAKMARQRAAFLQAVADKTAARFFEKFIGRIEHVLVEQEADNGWHEGRGEHYFPIRVKAPQIQPGDCIPVYLKTVKGDYVEGEHLA